MAVHKITDSTYVQEISKGLVLVDFWAEWCGPCKMLAPIMEELSNEMNEVKFTKINIDENQEMATQLNITAIPTMVLYKDGVIVDRVTSMMPKAQLNNFIQKHIQ